MHDGAAAGTVTAPEALLGPGWDRALELAWASLRAGTTPVGAVVVAPDGTIVAEGRGQRFGGGEAGANRLRDTHIAHAEINAQARLGSDRKWDDHVLLTTLEPCSMCAGAVRQSTLRLARYAAPDAYGGAAHVVVANAQYEERATRIDGPLDDVRGAFSMLLHVAWLATRSAGAPVAAHDAAFPSFMAALRAALDGLAGALERDDPSAAWAVARRLPTGELADAAWRRCPSAPARTGS